MTEKIRVYELAKEMLVDSKVIIRVLEQLDIPVKNHMSTMDKEVAEKVSEVLTGRAKMEPPKKPAKKPEETLGAKAGAGSPAVGAEREKDQAPRQRGQRPKHQRPAKTQRKDASPARKKRGKRQGRSWPSGARGGQTVTQKPKKAQKIVLEGPISIARLADKMGIKANDLIRHLIDMGIMASINQDIDVETATILGTELGFEMEEQVRGEELEKEYLQDVEDSPETLKPRPPVVTVMGHVDHGKTSLLDAIRHANVTAQEAGGITQHVGAYTVNHEGRDMVFIDTPGHEAFTAMRARGAQVTDLAVLVVAADDGVMPQTVEAINHAKAAGVPILVAINKIDKPNTNPDRVKQQLSEHDLIPEEWGGDVVCVPVSAKERKGIDHLLEMILLVSEMQDLKANPDRMAQGVVIEAELDKGRGPVATVIIQKGTLKVGDSFVVGGVWGKVRAMMDHRGRRLKKAGPSTPVEVIGMVDVPEAGDILHGIPDDKAARSIADLRQAKRREKDLGAIHRPSLEEFFKEIAEGEVKDLRLIIKADVHGSVEAVKQALEKIEHPEVRISLIHTGVGAITESDIMLAAASGASVIGFNVRPDANARKSAETEKVDIRTYRVIYEAIDDIQAALQGLLKPKMREAVLGRAEVRAIFRVPKAGIVAGCYVTEGKVLRQGKVRVIRDGMVLHEGKMGSLKRFKDDVREVNSGYECGISVEGFNDIREGDALEIFVIEEVKPGETA